MVSKKQERIQLLEKQINRLQRRINILDRRSTHYSWVRVAIFFGGIALSLIALFAVGWGLGLALAVLTLLVFAIAAHYHGKIDRSIARHTHWSHIKAAHIARIKLDWSNIPAIYTLEPQAEHPFEFDLDITGSRSLHQLLNVAVSREGTLRLRDWLLSTTPDLPTIRKRQALVQELAPMTLFRDKLLLNSLLKSRRVVEQLEGKRLLNWLSQQAPSASLRLLLWASAALNLLTVLLFLASYLLANRFALPQLWIFSLLAAVLLLFATGDQRGDIFEDASYLSSGFGALSSIFAYLEKYPYGKHQHLKKLCEPFFLDREHSPSNLLKRTARIASAATLKSNGMLWLIVNAFIPWDIYCAYRLQQYKGQIAARLPIWLDVWFELEALNSLATFAYLNPEYILPAIIPSEEQTASEPVFFQAQALGHPLIPVEKKVTNDFAMNELLQYPQTDRKKEEFSAIPEPAVTPRPVYLGKPNMSRDFALGEVVIITGSNMSGKSTFLRTLGVNLCLAYAGGVVCASTFQATLFRLLTCIRVSDSVTDGYSYFYAEVRRLKALLVELEQRERLPLFFLIDEIFKGTNNRERLIGSRSYVHALVGRNCMGAITTHDLELVKLADILPEVKNYHFREEVVDGRMVFDYRLRPGPCPTTNALKIMQMEGLPVEEQL